MFQEIYEAYEVILESLGASRTNIDVEFKDDLTWFYEWRRKTQLTADMDPFEVHYEQIWMPKIAEMLENLKKAKKKS